MASDGRVLELKDAISLASGGTPSKQDATFWGRGLPWVSAKDMGSFWIDETEDELTDAGVAKSTRVVPEGTVLILTRGMTLHKRVPICRVRKRAAFNQDVKAILPKDGVSPRFLPYLMTGNHERLHSLVDSAGHGTGRINTPELLSLKVWIPELREQEAIGDIGEAIDDRIDLLRQTNVTLEAIAQALFKSWFVDFDPVRAKAEGREPEGMDAATAALFPSEFEESELGLIPKGWSIRAVGDVTTITRGRSYKSSELADSDTALVTLKSFNRGGGFRRDGFKPYTGPFKPEQEVFEGDCIVAHTDVTQQAELIGRSALVTRSTLYSRHVASLDVGIVRPKTDELTSIFLSALLSGDRYVSHIKGYTSGTTVLHLSKDGLPGFKFACPSPGLVKAYSDLAFAMFQRQATNIAVQESLAELRDTLLPRLISGKLRLPDAEKSIEAAAA